MNEETNRLLAVIAEDDLTAVSDNAEEFAAELRRLSEQNTRLRTALAELVGASDPEELRTMEVMIRMSPAPGRDKAVMINAIHALLAP